MQWIYYCAVCVLFVVFVAAEEPSQQYENDVYSSVSYSAPYLAAKSGTKTAPYPTATNTATPPPATSWTWSVPIAPATGLSGPGPSASGPGPIAPGPSGPGPSGPGPSGLGPSGPGPFGPGGFGGPGPFGFGAFGRGPFGGPFGPGPFPYGAYPYGFKKGLLKFLLRKFNVGFRYLEKILAPIETITSLISVLNFLKEKVVPKVATKLHEFQSAHIHHDVAEALTAARRYRRSMEELDDLTQRVLTAIDKNMCTEKLVCQIGKKASQIVSVDSGWVNSTLGTLKKIERPNSLISIFRLSMSNLISNCDIISCKIVDSSSKTVSLKSDNVDKSFVKTNALDEEEEDVENEEQKETNEGESVDHDEGNAHR